MTEGGNGTKGWSERVLDFIEWAGNKLPDPAALFFIALVLTWLLSALLAHVEFIELDPRTVGRDEQGQERSPQPIRIKNQLTGQALTTFLTRMIRTFVDFPPLGVVLVAFLGVGVAEHTGFLNAVLKALLSVTPNRLLTPMLLLVAIVSHSAGDTGFVVVIPLGGVMFATAGRHPLAGIAAAFAGVAAGLSAYFLPAPLDVLLQGLTQNAAQILAPGRQVNTLCNYYFTAASCLVVLGFGWYLTDRVIEPRLRNVPVDGDPKDMPTMESLKPLEKRGLALALIALATGLVMLIFAAYPGSSPLRAPDGSLTGPKSPLMDALVPLIFLFFLVPGIVYGYAARTVAGHRDIIQGMTKAMGLMAYYLVIAFFAAQFTFAFSQSNLGAVIAIKGAAFLTWLQLPGEVTLVGIILLTATLDLLVVSASAKWALLGPIFVPMLMQLGFSPELTQAAYRVGDSCPNVLTPLLPYFPLIVLYCQKYVKNTGIGTVVALMVPYAIWFLISWMALLLLFWRLNIPLGLQAGYGYP